MCDRGQEGVTHTEGAGRYAWREASQAASAFVDIWQRAPLVLFPANVPQTGFQHTISNPFQNSRNAQLFRY